MNTDNKLIPFPHARENINAKKQNRNLKSSKPDVLYNSMNLGPWNFTCTKCGSKTHFDSKGMIFRVLDFYCSSCGVLHRVTNPAFSNNHKMK